jgi:hypothetical protein
MLLKDAVSARPLAWNAETKKLYPDQYSDFALFRSDFTCAASEAKMTLPVVALGS